MPSAPPLAVHEALARVLGLAEPFGTERVSVDQAIGRATPVDLPARRQLPPWDNSAMDGYAVRAADVQRAPASLQVVETIYAGHAPTRTVGPGECARIMTGARLPSGADAIVMQERTRGGAGVVEILEGVAPGHFVRRAGEDVQVGQALLRRGDGIGVPEAALLWAQGFTEVDVPRRPRVAIVSTGDELRPVGAEVGEGIVDTNGPALAASVRRAGADATYLGIARDDPAEIRRLLEQALGFDVVLTSAGVSVGERDWVKDVLEGLGVPLDFWRVAMKPGKPLAVGRRDRTLVFGLPGNPTSSLVSFELFVRPALRRALGHRDAAPTRVGGRSAERLTKAKGLTHFVRCTVELRDCELWARPLSTQSSGAFRSAASATHLLVFPEEATELAQGAAAELIPLTWGA